MNHPNITKVFEIYQDRTTKQTHIIQELLGGGNFLDFILNNGPLAEPEACKLLRGVLLAVQYMHSLGFAHRDLKPENLVLNTEHTVLKLIDFGFSKSKNDMYGLETPIGTPGWSSSDVMKGQPYSLAVDMWSIGCIVYFALFAVPPFNSDKTLLSEKVNELNQLVKIGTYTWPDNIEISETAKKFISRLLEKDPNVRMSATQALEHVWMTGKPLSTSQRKAEPKLNTEEKELLRQTINSAIDRARESADETAQNEVDAEVGGLQLGGELNLENYIPK
uniref:Protein kinase domain-containing protein n=1 Tax=Arcella intermedia TaxID=1963864 RepID=A0A6B2L9R8_9EUKA